VSSTPGSGGGVTTTLPGVTTTTLGPTTTTTLAGGCTTDDDCPTCQCCNLESHVCTGATGSGVIQCCNLSGQPPTVLSGACGVKTPATCPTGATCPPPGQLLGGTYYWCAYCAGSFNILEVLVPSGSVPPISNPTNACMRR
jgi:hypothetical protein